MQTNYEYLAIKSRFTNHFQKSKEWAKGLLFLLYDELIIERKAQIDKMKDKAENFQKSACLRIDNFLKAIHPFLKHPLFLKFPQCSEDSCCCQLVKENAMSVMCTVKQSWKQLCLVLNEGEIGALASKEEDLIRQKHQGELVLNSNLLQSLNSLECQELLKNALAQGNRRRSKSAVATSERNVSTVRQRSYDFRTTKEFIAEMNTKIKNE